jgi:hypothetical protein
MQMYMSMEQVAAVLSEMNSSPSPTVIKHVKYQEFQVPSSLDALAWFLLVEVDTDILPGHDASIAMA